MKSRIGALAFLSILAFACIAQAGLFGNRGGDCANGNCGQQQVSHSEGSAGGGGSAGGSYSGGSSGERHGLFSRHRSGGSSGESYSGGSNGGGGSAGDRHGLFSRRSGGSSGNGGSAGGSYSGGSSGGSYSHNSKVTTGCGCCDKCTGNADCQCGCKNCTCRGSQSATKQEKAVPPQEK